MRCKACDKQLKDYESTRKNPETGEYFDMCSTCLEISFWAEAELEIDSLFCWDVDSVVDKG